MNYPKNKAYEGAPEGCKRCSKCKKMRSLDDFSKRNGVPDGKRYDCKYCVNDRKPKQRSSEPGVRKNNKLKQKYNITLSDYNKIVESQKGCCAICGTHVSKLKRDLDIDHNHITGKIRKLLCTNCNRGLGWFKDNPELLRKAANYLCQHKGK